MKHSENYKFSCIPPSFRNGAFHMPILYRGPKKCKIPPNTTNTVVCAELPYRPIDPQLCTIVTANMIHGPGGEHNPSSVCMKNGTCSKGFPKPFLRYTEQGTDSYPKYRRRHPSNTKGRELEKVVDKQWVVLYNAWHHTMEKAAVSATPQSLPFLFVIIVTQCNPSDVRTLWLRNKTYLAEDFRQYAPTIEAVKNNAIVDLDDIVLAMGGQNLE